MLCPEREWPREWLSTYSTVTVIMLYLPGVFWADTVGGGSVVVEGALLVSLCVGVILFEIALFVVSHRLDRRGADGLLYGLCAVGFVVCSLPWYGPVTHLLG